MARRRGLLRAIKPTPDGGQRLALPGQGFDGGNYRPGLGTAFSAIALVAREFGDETVAQAAFASLDLEGGRSEVAGVLSYNAMSNLANANHVAARLRQQNGLRNAINTTLPHAVFTGPLLTEARYPDVLVAHARSDGASLRLVLHPGNGAGAQTLGFERLKPGARYTVKGSRNTGRELVADASGAGQLAIDIDARIAFSLVPAG